MPAIVGIFSPSAGILAVLGDATANAIEVGRNAAGRILVNGGAVPILGGTPTVANTNLMQIFGQGGDDRLSLDESSGALPRSYLFGGDGDDVLTGGSGADQLFGQAGNDTLLGKGGNDFLFGGADNDVLTGGDGDDQVFGESGDDRMVWNPGDDTDLNEGGAGSDTVEVNGGNGAEQFAVTANGTRVRFDRLNPAPFSIDIGTSENLVVNMNGGDDRFSATGNLAAQIRITVDGGAGNDTILGSNGADVLLGGDGDDFIDGNQGSDVALLGAGDDTFQWDPGDGSDTVEGQAGDDTMLFNGANIGEVFEVSANGPRVRLTRNIGNVVMDLGGVERIDLKARGGADSITIDDLSTTEVETVRIDLAGTPGGITGDAQADTVILNGTDGADSVLAMGLSGEIAVIGLPSAVLIDAAEGDHDQLVVNTRGGSDTFAAAMLPAGLVRLTVDAGDGDDSIIGSQDDDVLLGGDGDDFIDGDRGNDVVFLGAGDDTFQWTPGDGSDTVEGQAGSDLMLFFGSNASETINVSANGGRVRFSRDVGNVVMDLDDVERIEFRAMGGADNITVNDLTGTDLARLDLDLRGPDGGGDRAADSVTVNATNGDDSFGAAGDTGGVNVFGLQTAVNIFFQDPALDRLTLNAMGGADVVNASSLRADSIRLAINGGLGADLIIGSDGNDTITGGDGNDTALMGAGDDTFIWNPGDDNDVIEGQAGSDTMLFNGANVSESIDIAANGGRVLFTRNIANVVMDLNDVEGIDFNALGGADTIVVDDLSGTGVTEVNLNLSAAGGGGDGQGDTVIVQGTNGDDVALVLGDAAGVSVVGLAARVNITGAEAARDRLVVNALDGNDVVVASGLQAGSILLTADGGGGADVLIGGDGADVLIGGEGDDVLIGGPGQDVLDGGPGDDIEIQ